MLKLVFIWISALTCSSVNRFRLSDQIKLACENTVAAFETENIFWRLKNILLIIFILFISS